jgi:hypothetical protein
MSQSVLLLAASLRLHPTMLALPPCKFQTDRVLCACAVLIFELGRDGNHDWPRAWHLGGVAASRTEPAKTQVVDLAAGVRVKGVGKA